MPATSRGQLAQTVGSTPVTCSAPSEHSARRPRQVVRVGNPDQLAKVVDIVDNARREVYRLLADEPADTV